MLAVEEAAHRPDRLVEPVQALAEARPELDPVGPVLGLHPRAADAQDRPAAADVVEGRRGLGHDPWVAERVGADEQPEAGPLGLRRPRGERRPALEDRLVGVAEDRVEVVPRPEVVVAEAIDQLWPHPGIQARRSPGSRAGCRASGRSWDRGPPGLPLGRPRSLRAQAGHGRLARSASMRVRSSGSAIAASAASAFAFHAAVAGVVAGDVARAGHRLVGGGQVPVLAVRVGLGQLDAPPGVPERGLGPAEDRVHAGALPLAAGEVDVVADLAPVVARGVGGSGSSRRPGRTVRGWVSSSVQVWLNRPAASARRVAWSSSGGPGGFVTMGSFRSTTPRTWCRTRWRRWVRASIRARWAASRRARSAGSSAASTSRISSSGTSSSRRRAIVRASSSWLVR